MSAILQSDDISPAEYLLSENDNIEGIKHEYVDGRVYAMAGASRNHNRLSGRLYAGLFNHLEDSPCEVFQSDMKVGINPAGKKRVGSSYFYYPDIQVTCEPEDDNYYNRSPCLIIEVLSNSTARIDRSEKLTAYKQLESLQEYVLCSQDSPVIELHRRSKDWQGEHIVSGGVLTLESIGLSIEVDELYSFLLS
jgi:Uma2 family endonuclease